MVNFLRRYIKYTIKIDAVWYDCAAALLIILIVYFVLNKQNKLHFFQRISYCLLPPYVLLILASTVFCRPRVASRMAELTPFWTIKTILDGNTQYIAEISVNIAMFIPIGFLIPFLLKRKSILRTAVPSLLVSVGIEALQYLTCRGMCELDDVILNGLGALLGYCLFAVIETISSKSEKKDC